MTAATQWVDTPALAPPVQQDMVFQWVDSPPSYGRTPAPQHYMQTPAPPYGYPYMDPALGGLPRHDAFAATQPGLDPLRSPAHGLDPMAHYHTDPYGRPPNTLQMDDLTSLRMGKGMPGMSDHSSYGQSGGYGGHNQGGGRRNQHQGGGKSGGPKGSRMYSQLDDMGGKKGGKDKSMAPGRQNDGMSRRTDTSGADAQGQATLDSMSLEEVRTMLISTLESLYQDRIKPMANYIKGRLKERSIPDIIVKTFEDLFMQHPDLFQVENPRSGEETTIYFHTPPAWFKGWVDIDAADDPYDETMWGELANFLDGEHTFAGGRYGMARELMQRNLPFLAPYSLGEVCHIVQLAIQHRRLIVYHRKMLKPLQTVLCQLSPGESVPGVSDGANEGEEIKDMDDLTLVLFRMLMTHPSGIRLCRMKQMIKHEFSRKLSEMVFQCTKLIELFSQEPLASTFVLDTENDGKSIYVRLGNPEMFSEHVKRIYGMATTSETKQAYYGLQA